MVALNYLLANSKTYASPGVLRLAMQPLEHLEHLPGIARSHADSVVSHRKHPFAGALLDSDMHAQRVRAAELDRVGQKIGENLLELPGIRLHYRQRVARHASFALGDRGPEIRQHLAQQGRAIG